MGVPACSVCWKVLLKPRRGCVHHTDDRVLIAMSGTPQGSALVAVAHQLQRRLGTLVQLVFRRGGRHSAPLASNISPQYRIRWARNRSRSSGAFAQVKANATTLYRTQPPVISRNSAAHGRLKWDGTKCILSPFTAVLGYNRSVDAASQHQLRAAAIASMPLCLAARTISHGSALGRCI